MTSQPVEDKSIAYVSSSDDADLQDVRLLFKKQGAAQLEDFRHTKYLLVSAIDFGSTFAGYALSTRLEFKKNPHSIISKTWTAGSGCLQSLKTASCILFDENKKFAGFGFEAEDKYANLVEENKHHKWYFFRRFKMKLYQQKNLDWKTMIQTEDNKSMPAMLVFSACIKYLKEDMFKTCKKQGLDVNPSEIRWVVTVPAIWDDAAKQFMRKAAELAGLPGPQLYLALEAEAAALYCKFLPVDEMAKGEHGYTSVFQPASKYLVLDVGGGTVDLTVHEVQNDLTLKEIHMATGGDWGGTVVDGSFETLLCDIVGTDVFQEFRKKHPSDSFELLRSFEVKKRTIKPPCVPGDKHEQKNITFTIPITLTKTFEEKNPQTPDISKKIESNAKIKSNVKWMGDKMRLNIELSRNLFHNSLDNIKKHLQALLAKPEVNDISAIIMVGGYSECPLLQTMVEKSFPDRRLIVPNEAGLAILKGAVIIGHEPDTVTERICRYSYGIAMVDKFDPSKHKKEYVFTAEGKQFCDNIFSKHLTLGERVPLFVPGETRRYMVIQKDQVHILVEVFISSEKNPVYVTDPCCKKLGSVVIEMPDISKGLNRGVDLTMTIGGAEVEVKANDIHTQEKRFAYFDFIGSPTDEEMNEFYYQSK